MDSAIHGLNPFLGNGEPGSRRNGERETRRRGGGANNLVAGYGPGSSPVCLPIKGESGHWEERLQIAGVYC